MSDTVELPPTTRKPVVGVDATPDEQFPIRILEAYLYNCRTRWVVEGLTPEIHAVYDAMNEQQRQREAILLRAIVALRAVTLFSDD